MRREQEGKYDSPLHAPLWPWLMADRDDTLILLVLALTICSIGAVGVCV